MEEFQDKETKIIQSKAPLESDLAFKKKSIQEATLKLQELEQLQIMEAIKNIVIYTRVLIPVLMKFKQVF